MIKSKPCQSLQRFRAALILCCILWAVPGYAQAKQNAGASAYAALIIDDLGYRYQEGLRALQLQGQIAYAFLPSTPYTARLLTVAQQQNREILLHLPMQSLAQTAQEADTLNHSMSKETFFSVLENSLEKIPRVSGINNHMGSLLTSLDQPMHWLMEYMATKDLYFIDSRTTKKSVAQIVAQEYNIPVSRRNVFLDHSHQYEDILKQYQRFITIAVNQGTAIAIAHPFEQTLAFLEQKLPELKNLGIQLVSVRQLIEIQNNNSN